MNLSELDSFYHKVNIEHAKDRDAYYNYKSNIRPTESFISEYKVNFINCWGISLHPLYSLPNYHTHSYLEMMYVVKGRFLNAVEGNNFILEQGDMFFVPPGVYHSVDTLDGETPEDCVLLNIAIGVDGNPRIFAHLSEENPIRTYTDDVFCEENYPKYAFIKNRNFDTVDALMRVLHTHYLTQMDMPDTMHLKLAEFYDKRNFIFKPDSICAKMLCNAIDLNCICDTNNIEISDDKIKTAIPATIMLEYIKANCADITLEKVAEKFNYSFTYTSKVIKKISGVGFAKLVTQFKLENACEMLRKSALSVKDIALKNGYPSIEHFHRTFKDEMGITPAQYRKSKQMSDIPKSN